MIAICTMHRLINNKVLGSKFNRYYCQDVSDEDEIVVHLPDFDPVDVDHFINSIYGWREHKDDIFITQLHKLLQFGTHWMGKGPDFDVDIPMDQAQFIAILQYLRYKTSQKTWLNLNNMLNGI